MYVYGCTIVAEEERVRPLIEMGRPLEIDTTLANVNHVLESLMSGQRVLFSGMLTDKTIDEIKLVMEHAKFVVIGPSLEGGYAIIVYTNDTLFFCDTATMLLTEFKTIGVYCGERMPMDDARRLVYERVERLNKGDIDGFFCDNSYSFRDIATISNQLKQSSVKLIQPVCHSSGDSCLALSIDKTSCTLVDIDEQYIEYLPVYTHRNNFNMVVVGRKQKRPRQWHFASFA